MPTTVITPGSWELKLGITTPTEAFECEANGFHLESNPVTTSIPASFCAQGYDDVGSVTHAITIDFLGVLDDPAALWYWLWDNAGLIAKCEFTMIKDASGAAVTAPKFAADVRVVRPPLDAITTEAVVGSVTLPVLVGPTITKPTVVLAAAASGSFGTE